MKRFYTFLLLILISGAAYTQLNWYPQNSGTKVVLFDIQFIDMNVGWACGNAGTILHTVDGGLNWLTLDAPPNNTYYNLCFVNALTGYACGYGGKVIKTTDGGENWVNQQTNSDTYLYEIFFVSEDMGWAIGGDNGSFPSFISQRTILYTDDGGENWIAQLDQSHESPLRSIYFHDADHGYAVSEGGDILYTDDGGSNWNVQATFDTFQFQDIFFTDSMHGWVIGEFLGLPHYSAVFITDDGGNSWTESVVSEDFSLYDTYFFDSMYGYAVGGTSSASVIIYTTDGGLTWLPDSPGTDHFLFAIHFEDQNTGWTVGNIGTILSSAFPVDIEEEELRSGISVYPNPASEVLNIGLPKWIKGDLNMSLVTITGQMVFSSRESLPQGINEITIALNEIRNGMYLLVLQNDNELVTEKIIIHH